LQPSSPALLHAPNQNEVVDSFILNGRVRAAFTLRGNLAAIGYVSVGGERRWDGEPAAKEALHPCPHPADGGGRPIGRCYRSLPVTTPRSGHDFS
jgi:hypothetical protein